MGKAIALRTDLPQIVVPTTYAGSEMTPILGQTTAGRKTTLRSLAVLPEVVLYDVDLTLSLPPALSATSGLNAIAHAVEGLWAHDGNPIISLMAEEGIRALAAALPRIVDDPTDVAARSDAQYGAWLCATVLAGAGMALHHKLCHTLGGSFNLPHAETHAVILPHATHYNSAAAPEAMQRLCRALGVRDNPAGASNRWVWNAPRSREPPNSRWRIRTGIRAASSARQCSSCSRTPGTGRGPAARPDDREVSRAGGP